MSLPDLPTSQNTYQAALFASEYANSIRNHPRMDQIRLNRIKATGMQAPDWFIRMVDIEIDNILYRLDRLAHWGADSDPRCYAEDTEQFISVTRDMLLNFIKPERMYFKGINRAKGWLAETEIAPVKVDTLNENNSVG